jgi:sugar/nucleoside kinase (ribokinase family)
VVGDILLDVVVRLDGLIQPDSDIYGHAVVGAGGQAANVAAWIVALGGSAALVGRHLIRQELRRRGVILHSPPAAPSTEPSSGLGREGRTGMVVSVATPDGRRTMLTDRGVAADLRPDELDPAWFDGCGWLHLPAHSLARSPLREATLALRPPPRRRRRPARRRALVHHQDRAVLRGHARQAPPHHHRRRISARTPGSAHLTANRRRAQGLGLSSRVA